MSSRPCARMLRALLGCTRPGDTLRAESIRHRAPVSRVVTGDHRNALALAGCRAEPGLVDAILAEIGDEPGNLPLVEHALEQLWIDRSGGFWVSTEARRLGVENRFARTSKTSPHVILQDSAPTGARSFRSRASQTEDCDAEIRPHVKYRRQYSVLLTTFSELDLPYLDFRFSKHGCSDAPYVHNGVRRWIPRVGRSASAAPPQPLSMPGIRASTRA